PPVITPVWPPPLTSLTARRAALSCVTSRTESILTLSLPPHAIRRFDCASVMVANAIPPFGMSSNSHILEHLKIQSISDVSVSRRYAPASLQPHGGSILEYEPIGGFCCCLCLGRRDGCCCGLRRSVSGRSLLLRSVLCCGRLWLICL